MDSMGRPDSGILKLSLSYLGSYSECVGTKSPHFKPKYCLATINIPKSRSDFFKTMTNSDTDVVSKVSLKIGTCVPSSCDTQAIARIINRYSSHLIDNSSAYVNNCYEKEEKGVEDDLWSLLVISVFGVLMVLVVLGTLCEYMSSETTSQMQLLYQTTPDVSNSQKSYENYKNNSNPILYDILIAFSMKTNFKKIFDIKITDNSIQVFHGIRVLAMIWIISVHSTAFGSQWMNFRNPLDIRQSNRNLMSQLIVNGTFSVDCFFYISGFLVSYVVLKEMKRSGTKPNLISFYIHRYLRMTPSMMAVIAFSATVLRYLASGPQWTESITMFNGWCRNNWWINSLYLHNFINTDNMCLSHSWYSAVDMQFYLISPLILIPLSKKPVLGFAIAICVLISSMIITGALTVAKGFPAVPYNSDNIETQVMDQYFGWVYIKPYCRIGPYIVGIIMGYTVFALGEDIKMPAKKIYSIMGWFGSSLVCLGVILAMFPANNGHIPEVHLAALYSATSRTLWSLSMAWVTFACLSGNGGPVNTFLSAKFWMPLSRLTYCAYLVHPIVMALLYGSREQSFDYSSFLMTYFTIGHVLVTYVVSLVLSLLVEYPLVAISKLLITRKT